MSSLDTIIKDSEDYQFTGDDMKNITENKYNLIKYEELSKYDNIDQILGNNNGVIILFQNESANSGHWVGLWKEDNTIMYFDSFGLKPDDEIQYTEFNLRKFKESGESVPHLTHLLNESKYKISHNKYKLQKFIDESSTCGRWVSYRLLHKKLSHDEFADLFMKNKHYDPDFWISAITGHFGSWQD